MRSLTDVYRKASSVVVPTGAGISAESGIATFRAGDGSLGKSQNGRVATSEGFRRNPKLVQRFFIMRAANSG